MKILSRQELEFLKDPSKFGDGYRKVLRYRIRKKAEAMEWALLVVESYPKAMFPKRRYEKEREELKGKAVYAMFRAASIEVADTPEQKALYEEAQRLHDGIKDPDEKTSKELLHRIKYSYWVKVIALRDKLKNFNHGAG